MNTEVTLPEQAERKVEVQRGGSASDAVYAIGLIGAWVYYIGRAGSFKEGAVGFFKGFAWPALVVYKLLVLLEDKPAGNA